MGKWLLGVVLAMSMGIAAKAADLVVYSAAAMKGAMATVPAEFAAATGHHVRFVFGTAGFVRDSITHGAVADLVIAPPAILQDLVDKGFIRTGSVKGLGETMLGLAVKRGSPHPAIGTDDEFRSTLLAAPSVGVPDPATGATTGIYLAKMFDRMGLTAVMQAKLVLYPDGLQAMAAGAAGKVALGLGQISEILPVSGVELVGAIPAAFQLHTIYAAGLPTHAANPTAAEQLYSFLNAPARQVAFEKSGFTHPAQ
ncbi:MAG: substrate-binding domain-containing protein [Acetobacteraceae bacterium]|nr:substrate-binding domain-containing protein [Acetobacteraceae bacterium]